MQIVLNHTDPKTGKTGMDAWKEHTDDLRDRLPSDAIYEMYLNGVVEVVWDKDGNYAGLTSIDEGAYEDW